MTNYPTEQEILGAAEVLRRLPRGFLPFEIFSALAERVVLPCVELSIFRQNQNQTEILLTQREADDKYWPSAWHLPGGVLRATDNEGDFSSIFKRILDDELKGEHKLLYEPQFALWRFQETNRGRELVLEYFAEVAFSDASLKEGKFFSLDALPADLVDHYLAIIPAVAEKFHGYTQ